MDRGLEAYRSLYEAFLGGAPFANILMSSGVGSVSLSNLALTSPLGDSYIYGTSIIVIDV